MIIYYFTRDILLLHILNYYKWSVLATSKMEAPSRQTEIYYRITQTTLLWVMAIGCTACACQWFQPSIKTSTGTDAVSKSGPFKFFLQPFGCSSRWSWGSVREPCKVSSSWIAWNVVIPFAMLSSIRFMKNWYWDHFLRACAASMSHQKLGADIVTCE